MHIRKRYTVSYDEWKEQLKRDARRNILIPAVMSLAAWVFAAVVVVWLYRG